MKVNLHLLAEFIIISEHKVVLPKCKNKTRLSQPWSWSCANTPGLGLGLALPVLVLQQESRKSRNYLLLFIKSYFRS